MKNSWSADVAMAAPPVSKKIVHEWFILCENRSKSFICALRLAQKSMADCGGAPVILVRTIHGNGLKYWRKNLRLIIMARVKQKGSEVDSFSVNVLRRDRNTFSQNFFSLRYVSCVRQFYLIKSDQGYSTLFEPSWNKSTSGWKLKFWHFERTLGGE